PDLDAKMRNALADSVATITAIPAPFDQAIIHNRAEVQTAIDALRVQTEVVVEVATLLGLTLNLEE
ncbi:MAG: iron-regulated protein, partial [Nannocystaceae bacterium]